MSHFDMSLELDTLGKELGVIYRLYFFDIEDRYHPWYVILD